MASVEVKSFDSPDEVRPFEGNGEAKVVQLGGHTVGRGTFAGFLPGDLELAEGHGVMEWHDVRW